MSFGTYLPKLTGKAYKVVRLYKNDERTSVVTPLGVSVHINYVPGQVVYPRVQGSMIFVFEYLMHARDFMERYSGPLEIWECETGELKEIQFISSWFTWNRGELTDFWKHKQWMNPNLSRAPLGTRGVDYLKMVRRVEGVNKMNYKI
jgi:hypothetical protein